MSEDKGKLLEMGAGWLINHVGENPARDGLVYTHTRYRKAWEDWTKGYREDLGSILKSFEDGGEGYDEMVVETDIPVYSKCEHHLADVFGVAH